MSDLPRFSIDAARAFLLLLIGVVTLAFIWITAPFSGAILWGVVAALLFDPLNQYLLRAMPTRRNAAAGITLVVIVAVVIVPAILLSAALVREAAGVYGRIHNGDIDLVRMFVDGEAHLPDWARGWLQDVGLGDIDGVHAKLGQGVASSFRTIIAQTVNVGQGALSFFVALTVMLYLTFFLLRDGRGLATRIERAIPLPPAQRDALFDGGQRTHGLDHAAQVADLAVGQVGPDRVAQQARRGRVGAFGQLNGLGQQHRALA